MRKITILAGVLGATMVFAQEGRVGINTENPNATFEVAGSAGEVRADGIIAPRLLGWQLRGKSSAYGADQKGAIVYVLTPPNIKDGKVKNVDAEGYYYFDGEFWVKLKGDAGTTYTAGDGIAINNGVISSTAPTYTAGDNITITGNVISANVPTYTAGNGINIDENGQITATGENTNLYTNDGTLAGNRTVTMGNNTLKFTGNTTSFIKNGDALSLKTIGANQANYITFFRNGESGSRSGYLGYSSSNSTNFTIANELGNRVIISANNTDGEATTELASKLKINNLPVEHNANNALLVTDQQGNVKKANLYQAGEGISIDPNTNTISATATNGVSSNLYTEDGQLAGNRTVDMNSQTLNFADGNVGINQANPTAKLDIVSPTVGGGFKLADGSQEKGKVLTSDANGNANWAYPAVNMNVLDIQNAGIEDFTIPAGSQQLHYTGVAVRVPPGKWIYNISLGVQHEASNSYKRGGTFLRLRWLSYDQALLGTNISNGLGLFHPNAYATTLASVGIPFSLSQSVLVGTLGLENNTGGYIQAYLYADIASSNDQIEGRNVPGHKTKLLFSWRESTIVSMEVQ